MRPRQIDSGWAGSLFPEPITQVKPILLDDNSKVLALLCNERGELYCNCYGMIVKERKCHKCVGYVSESDTCRWVMSVHDAELVNGKWTGLTAPMVSHEDDEGMPLEPTVKKLSILDEPSSLDFSKEWYYCASGNAIRNHLPCDECIRSEPREEIHCIRFFKLHPCAYFNSAHCNGSTCEYWDPKTIACTYGPYLAWLAAPSAPAVEPTKLTEWVLSNCGKHHTCRDDCAGRGGGLCPFTVSREGGIPADLLDDRAKDDAETKAAKKPAKAKKPRCPDILVDCPERGECALNKFWKWRPCAVSTVEAPAKEPIAVLLGGKWYSGGNEISEVEARTGGPCDQDHACIIVADPKGKACDSRYPCRCFHCKGNEGPCGTKCGLYPEGTTGGKHGGCCMVQHKAKSRAEVELGVT